MGLGWLVLLGIAFFSILYFIIKWGVAAGILHAEKLRREDAAKDDPAAENASPPPGRENK